MLLTRLSSSGKKLRHFLVYLRPAVAVELPYVPDLGDLVEVQIGHQQFVLVAACLRDKLPPRVAEIAFSIELAYVPRRLEPDAVDRADKVAVGNSVRRLFELPQILREARHCRRWIKENLRAPESENPRSFGKMAVVADIDSDIGVSGLEDRVSQIPRFEIELFPESGI